MNDVVCLSKIVYENIEALAKLHNQTVPDIERAIDVSPGYLSRAKNGTKRLSIDLCCKVADYFKVSLYDLTNVPLTRIRETLVSAELQESNKCTLLDLLTSCQYPQVFWIYLTNEYGENILLAKGNKQDMFSSDIMFDLLDHINDTVEYWTIRSDGAIFVRLHWNERVSDIYCEDSQTKWDIHDPHTRPYLYSAEIDDFTNCIYGTANYIHPYGDPLERHNHTSQESEDLI